MKNMLILTNKLGSIHISTCTSKRDAIEFISGFEKFAKTDEDRIESAVIVDSKTGARHQIRGGTF